MTDDLGSVHTGSLERPLRVDRVDHGDAQARSWGALPPSALRALDSAGGVAQCWAQPPPPARPQCPRGHTCCPSFRTSLFLTALAPLHPQGPKAGVHLGQAFSVSVPTVCEGPCIPGGPPVASGAGRGPQGCSGTPWFSGWAPCASTPCPAPPWSEGSPSCDLPSALCPFTWTAPEQPSPLEGVGEPPAHQRPWLPHEESPPGLGGSPVITVEETWVLSQQQPWQKCRRIQPGETRAPAGGAAPDSAAAAVLTAGQSLSRVRLFVTPWTAAHQALLSFTVSQSLLKLMSIESVMPASHLILCRPLLLPPSSPMSQLFASGGKGLSFRFSITPSNSGSISTRTDWLDLLATKGLSRVFSSTTVQKHQFFGTQPSLWSNSHIHT